MARLAISAPDHPRRVETIDGALIRIGRDQDNEIMIEDKHLSRHHCTLARLDNGGYRITDNQSANGIWVNDTVLEGEYVLTTGDIIFIGQTEILYVHEEEIREVDGRTVLVDDSQPLTPATETGDAPKFVLHYDTPDGKRLLHLGRAPLTIGRGPSCGLQLDDGSVSYVHARIRHEDGRYHIQDLGSCNGVRINGKLVDEAELAPGMRIRIGRIAIGFKEFIRRRRKTSPSMRSSGFFDRSTIRHSSEIE